jgi:hypothetical protein
MCALRSLRLRRQGTATTAGGGGGGQGGVGLWGLVSRVSSVSGAALARERPGSHFCVRFKRTLSLSQARWGFQEEPAGADGGLDLDLDLLIFLFSICDLYFFLLIETCEELPISASKSCAKILKNFT